MEDKEISLKIEFLFYGLTFGNDHEPIYSLKIEITLGAGQRF